MGVAVKAVDAAMIASQRSPTSDVTLHVLLLSAELERETLVTNAWTRARMVHLAASPKQPHSPSASDPVSLQADRCTAASVSCIMPLS
jgi:hypothetical protein